MSSALLAKERHAELKRLPLGRDLLIWSKLKAVTERSIGFDELFSLGETAVASSSSTVMRIAVIGLSRFGSQSP